MRAISHENISENNFQSVNLVWTYYIYYNPIMIYWKYMEIPSGKLT